LKNPMRRKDNASQRANGGTIHSTDQMHMHIICRICRIMMREEATNNCCLVGKPLYKNIRANWLRKKHFSNNKICSSPVGALQILAKLYVELAKKCFWEIG
jgi:hypothetical protein